MGRTNSTVSDEKPPQPLDPETRSPEDVAREIGAAGRSGPADPPVDDDALHQGGRLRFDKSGALAGRPKLKPVRAHRKEGEEEADREAAAQRAEREGKPRKASLPPRIGALRPEGFTPAAAAPQEEQDDEVAIEGGTFLYGDARKAREVPAFRIDRYPVTNEAYARFVAATGHRAPLYWNAGQPLPDLADHPVVGVDYYDALAYAQWRGKDLPFEDEWERAARGNDGRVYPWGNDQELSGANTARVGLKMTVPIDLHPENVSPDGVRDMVGNVWEITHSPASGGGVVVRGGSWYDFALYAKTFFRFASRADARNGTIGFRCVRRAAERDPAVDRGATREIPAEQAAAEIAARRGEQPPVDVTTWSVEKRDLLPDLNRLRNYVAEARAEILLGAKVADKHPAPPPAIAFTPPPPPPPPEPEPEPEPEQAPLPPEVIAAAGHVTGTHEPTRGEAEVLVTEVDHEARAPAEFEAAPASAPERVHVLDTRAAPPPPPRRFKQPVRRHERAAVGRLPAARSMPTWMWGLLALGFLLFGGLIVVLVERGGNEQVTEPQFADDEEVAAPEVPDRLAGLPEPLPYEEFPGANEPPRIIDAAVESDAATLYSGLWLLLFANPATLEGAQTLQAAHELHRRVAPEGVRVAVVLPRRPYERSGGELPGMDDLRVALETDGGRWVGDAMHVVLDPEGEDDRGVLHARHANAAVPVTAVLLLDGAVERRTTPPEGGFSLVTLVGIAKRALQLARNP